MKQARLESQTQASTARLCALSGAIMAPVGLQLPFIPLWLSSIGLETQAIALIQATAPLARFFANFIIPPIADRTGKWTQLLTICACGMALSTLALGFMESFWPIYIALTLAAFAQSPMFPLGDAIFLREAKRRLQMGGPSLDYGLARGMGSAMALLLMISGGWALDFLPVGLLPFVIAGVCAASIPGILILSPPNPPRDSHRQDRRAPRAPLKQPGLLALTIAAAALVQGSHGDLYAFGSIGFRALGLDGAMIGMLWAAAVLLEIYFFVWIGARLGGPSRAYEFLIGGAACAALRWLLMAFATGPATLFCLQSMHAGSFAATHLGAIYAIARLVGEDRRAQGQGWLAGAVSLSIAASTLACGWLWSAYGQLSYLAMAGMAGLGCLGAWRAAFLNRLNRADPARL